MTMHKRLPTTEKRNPRSENIDERSMLDIVTFINQEDKLVAQAVACDRRRIAQAVDSIGAEIVMHCRGVHLPEALDILKENNELLRPAMAESTERV
jgi:CMP-2-keto-3-deoxyoctulosonic acid synthetase